MRLHLHRWLCRCRCVLRPSFYRLEDFDDICVGRWRRELPQRMRTSTTELITFVIFDFDTLLMPLLNGFSIIGSLSNGYATLRAGSGIKHLIVPPEFLEKVSRVWPGSFNDLSDGSTSVYRLPDPETDGPCLPIHRRTEGEVFLNTPGPWTKRHIAQISFVEAIHRLTYRICVICGYRTLDSTLCSLYYIAPRYISQGYTRDRQSVN